MFKTFVSLLFGHASYLLQCLTCCNIALDCARKSLSRISLVRAGSQCLMTQGTYETVLLQMP